eukprot:1967289-Amphidinium_carterae.1
MGGIQAGEKGLISTGKSRSSLPRRSSLDPLIEINICKRVSTDKLPSRLDAEQLTRLDVRPYVDFTDYQGGAVAKQMAR